jgi:hypothetical protein
MRRRDVSNIFSDVVKGFEWLGKKIADVPGTISRVITIADDVEADSKTLLPEVVTVVGDVGVLTGAIVKDGGKAFTALRLLSVSVLAAYADKGVNFTEDVAVLTTLKAFAEAVMAHGTWLDVIEAGEKTAGDFDKLGSSAAAALNKLEADV